MPSAAWNARSASACRDVAIGASSGLFFATALGLLIMIAAWAIVTGILEIVAAIKLRKEIKGEWLLIVAGLCSVVFGVLLMLMPGAGALVLVLWIGAYALVFGLLLMVLAFKVRRLGKEVLTPATARA